MNVFIGCSSRDEINDIYKEEACKLAEYLSINGYNLITGGADGLMGVVIDVFLRNKRDVSVMMVDNYQEVNSKDLGLWHYKRIGDRKYALINNANLIVFMPGGIGTYDEIFTVLESKRAKEHNLPVVIANINNYYEGIIKQLDKMYKDNFADYDEMLYHVSNDIDDAINYIEKLGVCDE